MYDVYINMGRIFYEFGVIFTNKLLFWYKHTCKYILWRYVSVWFSLCSENCIRGSNNIMYQPASGIVWLYAFSSLIFHKTQYSLLTHVTSSPRLYTHIYWHQRELGNQAWYLLLFHVTFQNEYLSFWHEYTSLPTLCYQTVPRQLLIRTMGTQLCKMLFLFHRIMVKLENLQQLPLLAMRVHYHRRRRHRRRLSMMSSQP